MSDSGRTGVFTLRARGHGAYFPRVCSRAQSSPTATMSSNMVPDMVPGTVLASGLYGKAKLFFAGREKLSSFQTAIWRL